ncbi:DUF7504 family protein [Halalkalicoccus ordinarius]
MLRNRGCTVLITGSVPGFGRESLRLWTREGVTTEPEPILVVGSLDQRDWSKYICLTSIRETYGSIHAIMTDSAMESTIPKELFDQTSRVRDELPAFQDTICQSITRIRCAHNDHTLPRLHVFVDSFWPVLKRYETQHIETFLDLLNQIAIGTKAVICVMINTEHTSSLTDYLAPYFDVNIDLRKRNGVSVQQRWKLPLSGHQTDWLPLNSSHDLSRDPRIATRFDC